MTGGYYFYVELTPFKIHRQLIVQNPLQLANYNAKQVICSQSKHIGEFHVGCTKLILCFFILKWIDFSQCLQIIPIYTLSISAICTFMRAPSLMLSGFGDESLWLLPWTPNIYQCTDCVAPELLNSRRCNNKIHKRWAFLLSTELSIPQYGMHQPIPDRKIVMSINYMAFGSLIIYLILIITIIEYSAMTNMMLCLQHCPIRKQ